MSDPLEKCFAPAQIGSLSLRNRLIKSATFEGKSSGGVPSPELMRLHERIVLDILKRNRENYAL